MNRKIPDADLAAMPPLCVKGNDDPTEALPPRNLTVADLAAMGVGGGGGVSDGDKVDVVVSGGGTIWTIDTGAVTTSKIADANVTGPKLKQGDLLGLLWFYGGM